MSGIPQHFVDTFQHWVRERPDHPAVVFLEEFDGPDRGPSLTYGQLDVRVRAVADGLLRRGLGGSQVLLLHPPGVEFLVALLGCLHAGVVAVPAPPPAKSGGRGAVRLAGIVADAGIRCVLTGTSISPAVLGWIEEMELGDQVDCFDEPAVAAQKSAAEVPLPAPDPATIAFLQYTSGSTSEPKGVMVTHDSLSHNLSVIKSTLAMTPDLRFLTWLPHYHDMGLVGQLLSPLYSGGTTYVVAPMAFLKRPQRWMQMISELRADVTVGPDFAYALATQRVTDSELADLDLSCLRGALNGSEPIQASTLERFVERFAPAGLSAEVVVPCYGMAEATLMVTCTPLGNGQLTRFVDTSALEANRLEPAVPEQPSQRLVSSGRSAGFGIRIVDPDTGIELPEGAVGEIWLSGPSVAAGYWGRPELTAATFGARLAGSVVDYLRTGDLGSLIDGELFVTGRIKEMLVLNGRNLYPQDLERTIREAHPMAAAGMTAVFSVGDQTKADAAAMTVAVQEVRPADLRSVPAEELVAALRHQVRVEHDVYLGEVVLVPTGAVARTTSGKVQRRAMRDSFLAGELRTLHTTAKAR